MRQEHERHCRAVFIQLTVVLPQRTTTAKVWILTNIFHRLNNGSIFGIGALALVASEVPSSPTINKAVVGRLRRNETPLIYSLASRIRRDFAEWHFLKPKTDYSNDYYGESSYPRQIELWAFRDR